MPVFASELIWKQKCLFRGVEQFEFWTIDSVSWTITAKFLMLWPSPHLGVWIILTKSAINMDLHFIPLKMLIAEPQTSYPVDLSVFGKSTLDSNVYFKVTESFCPECWYYRKVPISLKSAPSIISNISIHAFKMFSSDQGGDATKWLSRWVQRAPTIHIGFQSLPQSPWVFLSRMRQFAGKCLSRWFKDFQSFPIVAKVSIHVIQNVFRSSRRSCHKVELSFFSKSTLDAKV